MPIIIFSWILINISIIHGQGKILRRKIYIKFYNVYLENYKKYSEVNFTPKNSLMTGTEKSLYC